jgi:uncharacterized protein (TIGR02145 family)
MKTIFKTTILLLLLVSSGVYGQHGIGTNTPDTSALLELASTSKGFLIPRLTKVQRDAIDSPVAGLTVYCIDCNSGEISLFNGATWGVTSTGYVSRYTNVASNNSGGTYTFLNHNLGADTSLDPHTPVKGLNGDYYQWGRYAPAGDVDIIIGTWGAQGCNSNDVNWTPGAKGLQDPCPAGYRVPSQAEWDNVDTNNTAFTTGATWSFDATEFGNALHYGPDANGKLLTLPAAGYRSSTDGALSFRGLFGFYWSSGSSAENGSNAYNLFFSSSTVYPANNYARTTGCSVRCIAE